METVAQLADFQTGRRALRKAAGERENPFHVTRMMPRRGVEILRGGSLYWVIKGSVLVRQGIVALEPITTEDGIKRCRIVLDHPLLATETQPRRAFQGWRYLAATDAPADLNMDRSTNDLPREIEAKLRKLGAW